MPDSKKDTNVKNRLLDSVGKGEGGMIWENVYYHVRNGGKKKNIKEN